MVEESSLVTCLRLQKDQTMDASILLTWRNDQLDKDDVFAPEFLQQIIFCGVQSEDFYLEMDTERLFKDWQTLRISYAPYLDVGMAHTTSPEVPSIQYGEYTRIVSLPLSRLSGRRRTMTGNWACRT